MCWVIPPASPATALGWRMRSSRSVLPWSTWPMTVTTGGRGRGSSSRPSSSLSQPLPRRAASLPRGPLLLAPGGEADLRSDLGREERDHVVAEGLGRGHDLTLEEQEPDHVPRGAVELGPELTRRRAPLDE